MSVLDGPFPGDDKLMPIAIVGVGGRFPGDASNPEKLWDLLSKGKSARSRVPKDRFNIDAFYHPHAERSGAQNFDSAHFMNRDPEAFDAPFFQITPHEAKAMDPQQRWCLEVAYEAMENAGIPMESVVGTQTSCYVGCFTQDYYNVMSHDPESFPAYFPTGVAASCLSNRVSWFYDLHGPSMTIDTACSSSLVALHQACLSLRSGEAQMSLVGGVNFMCSPEYNNTMSTLHFLSPDGKCQSFDEKGNGYARGEGTSFIVIKPLMDAIRDKDTIRAVIRNTGSNQDGNTPGITLPSSDAQAALIRSTYARAGLSLTDTGYFEAHGTGTAAGDPIETAALGATFGKARPAGSPLWIGSVKANIGHLEGASGLAGLTKALYILEKGLIPPQIWLDKVNPRVLLDAWNLAIPRELMAWPTHGLRRVSVNSFGFGGANAHVVMDDAYHYLTSRGLQANHNTAADPSSSPASLATIDSAVAMSTPPHLNDSGMLDERLGDWSLLQAKLASVTPKICVLSSHEQTGISRSTELLGSYLKEKATEIDEHDQGKLLERLAYTTSARRSVFPWKSFVIASTIEEALDSLTQIVKPVRSSKAPKLGFCFTGQGAQHYAMGRELWAYEVYADSIRAADAYLSSIGCEWSLVAELWKDAETSRINSPALSQPVCTAVQVALVELLHHWGIIPAAVVGHSSGEIAAAFAKGSISREDSWSISYHRGRLSTMIKELDPQLNGAMLAAGVGEDVANKYLEQVTLGTASVACVNSPSNVTISGDDIAVSQIDKILKAAGVFSRKLKVETAYHSFHMEVIEKQYLESMAGMEPNEETSDMPKMFSSVTGALIKSQDLGPAYWVSNMLNKVRFSSAVDLLLQHSDLKRRRANAKPYVEVMLELGPHGALQGPLKQILGERMKDCKVISALSRGKNCSHSLLEAAGVLFQSGYPVILDAANNTEKTSKVLKLLVDLPPYAWNHKNKYWCESALAASYRFRKLPRNDLLGTLTDEWNESEPAWRHFFRLSENPWIEDHSVHNTLLYPAAGMMAMALEAAAQLADKSRGVEAYELRDVLIGKAMIVPRDEDGVETMLHVKPWRMGSQASTAAWKEFTIYSRPGREAWSLNCSGLLRVVYKHNNSKAAFRDEVILTNNQHHQKYKKAKAESTTTETSKHFYDHQNKIGLQLGISFRNLIEINKGDDQSACTVRIPDMASTMPMKYITKHVIHPCTLDAIIQTLLPTVEGRYEKLKTAAIPTYIEKLYVSADIPSEPQTIFQTYSVATYTGISEAEASVYASVEGWRKPLVAFERIRATRLSSMVSGVTSASDLVNLRKITGEFYWKEDVAHMTPQEITSFCAVRMPLMEATSKATLDSLDKAGLIYADRALQAVPVEEVIESQRGLYKSLQEVHDRLSGRVPVTPENKEDALAQMAKSSIDGELLSRLGRRLPDILRGQAVPNEIVSHDDIMVKYETQGQGRAQAISQLSTYLELLAHDNPSMRILEVNCTYGAITHAAVSVLEELNDSTPWCKSYTCTNSKGKSLDNVAASLANHGKYLTFQQLDITEDPIEQGFKKGEYDLIVGTNFSRHTPPPIATALENCKTLLKPGGKLLLGEVMKESSWYELIFSAVGDGSLGPLLPEELWSNKLIEAGFTGIDLKLPDLHETQGKFFSFIVSTSTPVVQGLLPSDVVIVEGDHPTEEAKELSESLCVKLQSLGTNVNMSTLEEAAALDLKGVASVVLAAVQHPLLFDLQPQQFEAIRKIILGSASTTWATRGGTIACKNPKMSLITGLTRSIRQEDMGIALSTIDFDPEVPSDAPVNAEALVKALRTHSIPNSDQEFAIRSGRFMTPRVHLHKGANDLIATHNVEATPEPGLFKQDGRALTLTIGVPGMLDTLHFKDDEAWAAPLRSEEVEIKVKASGLNFMDIMVAMDQVQEPAIGLECSGVITRTGSAVQNLKVGDRVMTWLLDGFSNYARNDQSMFQPIPAAMDFETAASLPMIYSTAYQSLIEEARLTKEDKILIHAAAGGVGQAAIMIARHIGAEIFATVGSQEKKDHIMRTYGVLEDHIFNSRDLDFVDGIQRMTDGKGVDVILNSLAGEALRKSWHCLAWFGRFIELGKKDISGNTGLDMAPFLRNQSFHAVNVIGTLRASIPRAAKMFHNTMNFFIKNGCSAVSPVTVMGFCDVEKGFRLLQSGKAMGKIVFKANDGDVVQVIPRKVREAKLDPAVTYVISGGLGGLGRSLSKWMIDHGAMHLAFLSRSGTRKPKAQILLTEIQAKGIDARAYVCDIGDGNAVHQAVKSIEREMPTIRGVIQAAMSLADAAFINMTPAQWTLSVTPKAAGTFNLHHYMPKNLDFFVMLSSSSGIAGTRGQGNYAAGNTFEDAMAHYRRGKGLSAVAIDVGPVLGAGHVAENTELIDSLGAQGYVALREEEFIGLIQAAITGVTVSGIPCPSQLITGFATGGLVAAEGWEMPYYLEDAKMRHIVNVDVSGAVDDGVVSIQAQIRDITSVSAGADIVSAALAQKLSKLMMISADDLDVGKPISTYGVDSLTAVELRAWSFRELQSDISIFDIMSNVPISTLARTMVSKSKVVEKEVIAADM